MLKKKLALAAISTATLVAPIAAVVSCNMSVGFKPSFYNYEAYMNQELIDKWNEDWNYKEFPDLPQFELLLKDQRTYGGVGSDYLNAKLAKQGIIQKIDFDKALHIKDIDNSGSVDNELQAVYTTEAWDLMKQFDSYIQDKDNDGNPDPGNDDHLWEYMIPYFIQNKVVAFNFTRGNLANMPYDENLYGTDITVTEPQTGDRNPANLEEAFRWADSENYHKLIGKLMDVKVAQGAPFTYKNIFKLLQSLGFNDIVINDYFRDNMMIGSESEDGVQFTGKVTEDNYKSQIDGFESLISMYDEKHRTLETSGADTLSYLIDPSTPTYDSALMYNGDSLDAYYSSDNFETETEGNIRVIEPLNPTYLLDGVIVSNAISGSQLDKFYESIYSNIYQGAEDLTIDDTQWLNEEGSYTKSLAINYDFVNYTAPFQVMWNWLKDENGNDYFEGDTIATEIADLPDTASLHINKVDANHITTPVDDRLQNQMYLYYTSALYK